MKRKFLHDISANSVQVMVNQFCGLCIFYILSTFLEKKEFGEINWSLALLLSFFSILTGGMDQVLVKKIAAGNDASRLVSAYTFHVLISGILFYAALLLSRYLFPSADSQYTVLVLIGLGKLMVFFSTPFKQLANGLEQFKALLWMSICSNVVRSLSLVVAASGGPPDMSTVIMIFIAGDIAELLLCFFIVKYGMRIRLHFKWDARFYRQLLKESLPQLGVVIFTAAIARLDWILLGLLVSNVVLAEYSFSYKVFELASLPLLVIAPILIPRFTKFFHDGDNAPDRKPPEELFVLLRLEMIIASLTVLLLNILWVPVIDAITEGKYGVVNQMTILILSASLPFLYFNNFLWTINFARGRLKMIFYVFMVCFIVNLLANLALIPFYAAEGAAIAYLLMIVIQAVLFLQQTKLDGLKNNCYPVLVCPVAALAGGTLANWLFDDTWLILGFALFCFFGLLIVTRQLRSSDRDTLKRVIGAVRGNPSA